MKAVVLLSGGIDSTTCAFIAKEAGFEVHALSFRYGQRHTRELEAAKQIAKVLPSTSHRIVDIDLSQWGGSSLVGDGEVPTSGLGTQIPSTWVPSRNLVFLSIAHAYAEALGAKAIYIGVNSVDYSGYPDCRPEFIAVFAAAAHLSSKAFVEAGKEIRIVAPLQHLSKTDIIRAGRELGVPYNLTYSCYQGGDAPCGVCDSCRIRSAAFDEVEKEDNSADNAV